MADQAGFPLRALMDRLEIKPDPELGRVEALAFQIQRHRQEVMEAQEEVSRTSLLHACGLIQPSVYARLGQAGLDRAAWEGEYGLQDVRFEIPSGSDDSTVSVKPEDLTPVLERYAAAFPGRLLDALGLAWAIAAQDPQAGGVGRRLQRAGLNRDAADTLLATDIATGIGLAPLAGLEGYRLTPPVSAALEKAKALASERGPGVPLTASFLLIGLIRQGEGSTLNDTADLLWRTLADPSRFEAEIEEYLDWYGTARSWDLPPRWMTRRVGEIFESARDLSMTTRRRSLINARSLLGAILAYRTPEGANPLGAHLLLERLGSSAEAMTAVLLDYLRTNAPPEGGDNLEAWEDFFLSADRETGPANVARVDAESLGGKDLLRIEGDITSFSLLLASASLTPPLAIGLFGNWGAGKSFFMKKLFERIADLARKAEKKRSEGRPTPLHGQIVQIELNAWHYEETNLWASMVTHIFESLHRHFAPREDQEKQRWAELLKKLSEASLGQDGAKTALDQAEKDLEKARAVHEAKKKELGTVVNAAWSSIKATLGEKERKELEEALAVPQLDALKENLLLRRQEALELKDRVALHRQTVVRMLGKPSAFWLPAVVLAGSLGLAAMAAFLKTEAAQNALATVAEVLAFTGGISSWLGSAFRKASGVLGTIDKLQDAVRKEIENTATADQLNAAEAAVELARQKLEEQQAQVATLRAEVEVMRPGQRLLRFLEDRAGSSDYRKHLGLPALVRRDFEQLQKLLSQELLLEPAAPRQPLDGSVVLALLREEIRKLDLPLDENAAPREVASGWEVDDPANQRLIRIERPDPETGKLRCRVVWTNLPRIDRIILYIDDLDRCPPNRVVEVLRSIQLLLAFPLFVVVVGVDARWVKRSLNVRYKDQFRPLRDGSWDGATPQDYIEKIFQIPFWLEPMSPKSTERYLEGLLGISPETSHRRRSGAQIGKGQQIDSGGAAGGVEAESLANDSAGAESAGQEESVRKSSTQAVLPVASSPAADDEPLPDLLEIEPLEQDFMLALAPLVRRTPRSVKRFVNIYRLYRASRAKGRLSSFLGTQDAPGPYREALLLLGLLTAGPDIAPQVFLHLRHAGGATLDEALNAVDPTVSPFSSPSWIAIESDLRELVETLAENGAPPLSMNALRKELGDTARYSFLEMPPL